MVDTHQYAGFEDLKLTLGEGGGGCHFFICIHYCFLHTKKTCSSFLSLFLLCSVYTVPSIFSQNSGHVMSILLAGILPHLVYSSVCIQSFWLCSIYVLCGTSICLIYIQVMFRLCFLFGHIYMWFRLYSIYIPVMFCIYSK